MKNLRLKAARAALDMSQAELAKRVNVSRQTIVAIEKGDYNPTIKLCIAICHEAAVDTILSDCSKNTKKKNLKIYPIL